MQIFESWPRLAESEGLKGEPSKRIIEYTHHNTQGDFQKIDSNQPFKIENKVQEYENSLGGSFQETVGADPAVMAFSPQKKCFE